MKYPVASMFNISTAFLASHIFIKSSDETETTRLPSDEKAQAMTGLLCPCKVAISL
jgi:hypothetical protein